MRPGDTLKLLAPPWPMLQCSPIQVKVAMAIAQITTTVQLQPSKKVVYYVVCICRLICSSIPMSRFSVYAPLWAQSSRLDQADQLPLHPTSISVQVCARTATASALWPVVTSSRSHQTSLAVAYSHRRARLCLRLLMRLDARCQSSAAPTLCS